MFWLVPSNIIILILRNLQFLAQTMKHCWDAFVRTGFTENQATRIVGGFAAEPDK